MDPAHVCLQGEENFSQVEMRGFRQIYYCGELGRVSVSGRFDVYLGVGVVG